MLLGVQAALFAIGAALRRPAHAVRRGCSARWSGRGSAPPADLEDPAPPRFAQAVGLAFALVGLVGLPAGADLLGPVATGFALVAALLNAVFGFCLGCEMYLLLRRIARHRTCTPSLTALNHQHTPPSRTPGRRGRHMSRENSLVTAEWVEDHLDDPSIVLVEVDEDTTAYDKGHIRGAIKLDWTTDLQDQVRRDFVNKAAVRGAALRRAASATTTPSCCTAATTTGSPPTPTGTSSSTATRTSSCSTAAARSGSSTAAS